MPADDGPSGGPQPQALTQIVRAGASLVLRHQRTRRHVAVLAAIIAVVAFGYGLLDPRTVRVLADGSDMTVQTHLNSDQAVLEHLGVELNAGDRLTALSGGDGSDVLQVERARRVRLVVDGVMYEMLTHAETVDQLLAEANVAIEGRDSVLQDGELVPPNAHIGGGARLAVLGAFQRQRNEPTNVEVRRALPLTIVEDGRDVTTTSSRMTVSQALREAGIVVGPGDLVEPGMEAELSHSLRIEIRHAKPVTIALPDGHRVVYSLANRVDEVLAEAGIVLPPGGFVHPPLDTEITHGLSVRVVQLAASSDVEYEYIAHTTIYESDASLAPGDTRIVQGHDGVLVRRYEISYVNGEEVGRELVDEYFDPEPQDTVIYYPTRTGRNESAPDASSGQVGNVLRMYATYYTPASSGRSPDDPNYGVTATGVQVTYGIVAVDPNVIPLGTKLFIPGYGYAVAADTGGAVKGNIIDLGFPDGVEIDWASQWVDVYILE